MGEASAKVVQLQVSVVKRQPMVTLDEAMFKTGRGIEGDRHAGGDDAAADKQVLMRDAETLTDLGIDSAVTRENVTTRGLDIAMLTPGKRVRLGDSAVVEVTGDCDPCENMDAVKDGLRAGLQGRRGILGKIVADGAVHPGDAIAIE